MAESHKPPRQALVGSGFILEYNPDTAPGWPCVKLRRRVQVATTAGIIKSPVTECWYEIYTDGEVRRVMPDGESKVVPDGHTEWRWVKETLNALRNALTVPPDLVRWQIGPGSRRPEYKGAKLATVR